MEQQHERGIVVKKSKMNIAKRIGMLLLCMMLGLGIAGGDLAVSAVSVAAAEEVVNGWDDTHTIYYQNGTMVKGKKKIGNYWYYFNKKTGKVTKNKLILISKKNNKYCYYDKDGHAVRGEQKIGKFWYYFKNNYAMTMKGFVSIKLSDNVYKMCYYNKKGHRIKGLKKINGSYYLFDTKTGAAKVGFQKVTRLGKTYTCYFDTDGKMVLGDKTIDGVTYSFNKTTGNYVNLMIAHASGNEWGGGYHGQAGDQTGTEVCIRSWYNRPWNVVLRPKSSVMAEKIAYAMERAAKNDNIGYDMGDRNTLLYYAKKVGYDPGLVSTPCETDCSALVSLACMYAGIPQSTVMYDKSNSATTGVLRSKLLSTGKFKAYTSNSYIKKTGKLKRGDILLLEYGHTAVVVGKWNR